MVDCEQQPLLLRLTDKNDSKIKIFHIDLSIGDFTIYYYTSKVQINFLLAEITKTSKFLVYVAIKINQNAKYIG